MNKDIINEFYLLALVDITNGRPLQELEEALDLYEQREQYESCAGILKAIHEAGYKTIRELINDIEDEQRND